jgi:FkbM family methyltransferase
MFVSRIARFVGKPVSEKRVTARFFARKALSRLPFMPVRVHLNVAPGEELRFWWSYLPHIDHADRTLTAYWGDDCGELRFLWRFLEPGMVFFDVGAYHGIFSVLAGRKLASDGQVVAFEPSPRERRRFLFHIHMNGLSRVELEPLAVSGHRGTRKFFTVASDFSSMNSLQPPPIDWPVEETTVPTVAIDDYLAERRIGRIDLMKIDVEGAELEVFRSARRLLSSLRPILICEVLDWVTQPWGYAAREIVDCLRAEGYEWFNFRSDGRLEAHPLRGSYPEIRNYLAVPREKLFQIDPWRNS